MFSTSEIILFYFIACMNWWMDYIFFVFQIKTVAREVYDKYFRVAQATPRGVVAQLCSIVAELEAASYKHTSLVKVTIVLQNYFICAPITHEF